MKNQQIYQQKAFLTALACFSALMIANPFCHKIDKKRSSKPMQTATIIDHNSYIGGDYYPMMQFLLDTDGDKKTAEAVCEIPLESATPLTEEDLKQILPVNTVRTVWELSKLGRVSKLEQR